MMLRICWPETWRDWPLFLAVLAPLCVTFWLLAVIPGAQTALNWALDQRAR